MTQGSILVGRSRAIEQVRVQIERLGKAGCDVLITGETGTGKEVVARLIHSSSSRARRPLVCLNCGAFPSELIESELFGYEAGAFTGAQRARVGLLQSAQGGIVFLDEIGEMSLPAQIKLLRVLESREVRRLGSNRPEPIDIRFLAAANTSLEALIDAGRFRADFYHRIRAGRIHLPPLRERPEDIPLLVDHVLAELSVEHARPIPVLSEPVREAFQRAPWPGNVRELRNELAGAFALATGSMIELPDLSPEFRESVGHASRPDEEGEGERIRQALEGSYWNVSLAAERLGISRQSLYRKLRRHKIGVPEGRRRRAGA